MVRADFLAPDLRDAHIGVDGELAEGRTGDVDLDHQVRWRVHGQIHAVLAADLLFVLDVEAGVGLEAALQLSAILGETRRAVVLVIGEQTLVGVPRDVMKNYPLLRRALDHLHLRPLRFAQGKFLRCITKRK